MKTGGPDYPSAMGMPRADLARILLEHAQKAGANIHFGTKITGVDTRADDAVEVFVDDESAGEYDLLIGADGLQLRPCAT